MHVLLTNLRFVVPLTFTAITICVTISWNNSPGSPINPSLDVPVISCPASSFDAMGSCALKKERCLAIVCEMLYKHLRRIRGMPSEYEQMARNNIPQRDVRGS